MADVMQGRTPRKVPGIHEVAIAGEINAARSAGPYTAQSVRYPGGRRQALRVAIAGEIDAARHAGPYTAQMPSAQKIQAPPSM